MSSPAFPESPIAPPSAPPLQAPPLEFACPAPPASHRAHRKILKLRLRSQAWSPKSSLKPHHIPNPLNAPVVAALPQIRLYFTVNSVDLVPRPPRQGSSSSAPAPPRPKPRPEALTGVVEGVQRCGVA